MAQKTMTASGNIIAANTIRKVYKVVLSATANATATFMIGGAAGAQNGPVVRVLANDTAECCFPGGVVADYVTLSGAGVNCWIDFS